MSTLTVVLSNYNHATHLPTSLNGIAEQSHPADEWIIIDDASTDDSVMFLKNFQKRVPNIQLKINPRNQGVIANLNQGIAESQSDYICLAAADDRVLPSFFEEGIRMLDQYPQAAFFCSDYCHFFEDNGTRIPHLMQLSHQPAFFDPDQFRQYLKRREHFTFYSPTIIYRRHILQNTEPMSESLKWHSDWFLITLMALRHGFCYAPRIYAECRQTPASYSKIGMQDSTAQKQVIRTFVKRICQPAYQDVKNSFLLPSTLSFQSQARRRVLSAFLSQPSLWRHFPFPLLANALWRKIRPALWKLTWPLINRLLPRCRIFWMRKFGAEIAEKVSIGSHVTVARPWHLALRKGVQIQNNVQIHAYKRIEILESVIVPQNTILSSGFYMNRPFSHPLWCAAPLTLSQDSFQTKENPVQLHSKKT